MRHGPAKTRATAVFTLAAMPSAPPVYVFRPRGLDAWERSGPAPGTRVVKVQPRGCPRNGMLGHCYVADAESGRLYGLVLEASLVPLSSSMTMVR